MDLRTVPSSFAKSASTCGTSQLGGDRAEWVDLERGSGWMRPVLCILEEKAEGDSLYWPAWKGGWDLKVWRPVVEIIAYSEHVAESEGCDGVRDLLWEIRRNMGL